MYRNKPINNWRHLEDRHTTVRNNKVVDVKRKLEIMNVAFSLIKFNLEDADIQLEAGINKKIRTKMNKKYAGKQTPP